MMMIEEVLATLAQVDDPALADLALVEILFDQPALLRPAQQTLDRLRDHGQPRHVEHLDGGWWRVGDGLERITEAAGAGAPQLHPRVLLAGCAGAPGPLWVDPALPVPASMLAVAWEVTTTRGPLALLLPGRIHLPGGVYQLARRPRQLGRTLEEVEFIDSAGHPAGLGTVIEVGDPADLDTLGHELVHALGSADEDQCRRLGALLARAVTGQV